MKQAMLLHFNILQNKLSSKAASMHGPYEKQQSGFEVLFI